jgi:hypothetical protein
MNLFGLDCSKAFSMFFDTPIAVSGDRANGRVAGNFNACVFDQGFASAFSEADADTTIHTYSISILAGDWLEKNPPQIGDKVVIGKPTFSTSPNLPTINLVVSHIDQLLGDVWIFTAREVK